MDATAIGFVSDTCHECEELRKALKKAFDEASITLNFVEVNYDDDPAGAAEAMSSFGLTSPPSFFIGGIVFSQYYGQSQLNEAIANIKKEENP